MAHDEITVMDEVRAGEAFSDGALDDFKDFVITGLQVCIITICPAHRSASLKESFQYELTGYICPTLGED